MKKLKLKGNVRDAALSILWAVENQQAYSNLLLNDTISNYGLADKDKGLLTEITYGTLQHRMTLDFYLDPYIKKKLEPWVRTLLRLSLYQMVYLDRVPERAAIHEAVEIAKKRGHGGIGSVVNGILRSIQRNGLRSLDEINDPTLRLSIETSHPEWLIRRWIGQYGFDKTKEMAIENNLVPRQTVRVNLAATTTEDAIRALEAEGLSAERSPRIPECLFVSGGQPAKTAAFKSGLITIQDESSMLPVYALQPEPGMTVLDMCAAPGGKATHIAEKMQNTGKLYAMDLHPHKVKLIDEAAARLGHTIIKTEAGDARSSGERFDGIQFDRILLDAPCSGLGVIKRKPDIKYTKSETDFQRLQGVQLDLLNEAVYLLKPQGILVYSTCTVDQEENNGTVARFLETHPNMELIPAALPGSLRADSPVQIFPQDFGGDGFFVAAFQKRER
ncbi:16S rRNA (cytosine(967)-C(5))-methyltransferase RsmB [Planococcus lenghuensis]|uniref:16S rRNA (cytosine(967)-C(5))-methyltransferase n=1 Tax=Planococcus lenghuensis TaxID=2213202 RepID=A0A1Q2L042_9BACL|nr:16S rRNA (cytosine(967)-C(5))-methyltransferase RsmB [Planococcus lenghuensis]AQQ53766.1 16S rRNA (cytosine(967)-C(5))-methyltransferase [Planococcus lenghuensis]